MSWQIILLIATSRSARAPAAFPPICISDTLVRTPLRLLSRKPDATKAAKEAYLEQLIVRRELAINFVRFNPDYDNFESGAPWAHKSLAEHAADPRKIYSERQLEDAQTHDPLSNAAQMQMVKTGFMHNYMRMYWAKKILEWSKTPARAFQMAVYLNDKYELDGRDPNGYAGIAWAIVGKHDRPWFERPIFWQDPLHVIQQHVKKVRQQELYPADGSHQPEKMI